MCLPLLDKVIIPYGFNLMSSVFSSQLEGLFSISCRENLVVINWLSFIFIWKCFSIGWSDNFLDIQLSVGIFFYFITLIYYQTSFLPTNFLLWNPLIILLRIPFVWWVTFTVSDHLSLFLSFDSLIITSLCVWNSLHLYYLEFFF